MRRVPGIALPLVLSLVTACGSDDDGGGNPSTGGAGSGGTSASGGSGGTTGGTGGTGGTAGGATGGSGGGTSCGTAAWSTYGHDGQRTSRSDGCIAGALKTLWGYTPVPPSGKDIKAMWHPLATSDAVYLHWSATVPPYVGTTAADRIDTGGQRVWTFDSGTDADFGDWMTLWKDRLVLEADGVFLLDVATGKKAAGTGVDWWGQSIGTDSALLLSNTSKADGPGLFVAALDDQAKALWKQNEQGTQCGEGLTDQTGGIALDGTTLFYAPRYATGSSTQPTFPSGVYAFDTTANGAKQWSVPTSPQSAISAANGLVYLLEKGTSSTQLVARKQQDGSQAWSVPLSGNGGVQAPAIANDTVIVGTSTALMAFAAGDGSQRWSVPQPHGSTTAKSLNITNGCAGSQPIANLPTTAIAIAGGNSVVVVAEGSDIFLLSLDTGAQISQMTPDGVTGTLVNPIVVGNRIYVVEKPVTGAPRLVALEAG